MQWLESTNQEKLAFASRVLLLPDNGKGLG